MQVVCKYSAFHGHIWWWSMADASSGMLRDELNARVSARIDRAWPSLLRVLSRMARARWDLGVGATHRQRWRISTTARLLEPPQPIPLDLALGGVGACVHVEVQCAMPSVVEGWTVSFRAFPDRDEVQITGA